MEVEHAGDAVDSSRYRAPGCASSLSSAAEGKEGGCDPEQESSFTCQSEGSKISMSEHGELDGSVSLRASLSPREGPQPEGSPAPPPALGSPTSPSEVSTPVPAAEGGLSAPDLADLEEAGVLAPAVPGLAASRPGARSNAQDARVKEGSPASGARTAPAGAESQRGAELPFVPGLQEDLDAAAVRQAAKEASFAEEEHLRTAEDDLAISTPPPEELAEGAAAASDADEEPPLAAAGATKAVGESGTAEEATSAVLFANASAAMPAQRAAEQTPSSAQYLAAAPSETPEPLPARRASLVLDDVPDAALPAMDFYPRKSASPLTRKLEELDRAQWAHIPFEPVPHISRLQRDQGYSAAPSGAIVKTQVCTEDSLGAGLGAGSKSRRQMAHDREAELLAALPSLDALPLHRSSLEIARDAARAQAEPRSATSGRRPSVLAASQAASEFPPLEAMLRHRCRLELEMEVAKLSGGKLAPRSARGEARHALESELPPLGALPKKHSKLEMEREAFRRASQSAGADPAAVL